MARNQQLAQMMELMEVKGATGWKEWFQKETDLIPQKFMCGNIQIVVSRGLHKGEEKPSVHVSISGIPPIKDYVTVRNLPFLAVFFDMNRKIKAYKGERKDIEVIHFIQDIRDN